MNAEIPKIQTAVQLVGPDRLKINNSKTVEEPGPYQILAEVEAVGLCFSDLKLLKQFSNHVRKSNIVSGIDESVLKAIPSYVHGDAPTVPGHETVVRIAKVGSQVEGIKPGQRFLVQTDYRWLPTADSNAAFGYNFEGALQQYVLMDQRVITSPEGQSMLIPAADDLSASAIALVEPWACVEDAYAVKERTFLKNDGQMLIVADDRFDEKVFVGFLEKYGTPCQITILSEKNQLSEIGVCVKYITELADLPEVSFDDIVYFGSNPKTVEGLFSKVAASGLFNIVLCGGRFGRAILSQVGRVHYGNIRIIGTVGNNPAEAMDHIPKTAEIRAGDKINVIGAAGPMGIMHVVRNLSQGIEGVKVYGGDLDDERLKRLKVIAAPVVQKNNVDFVSYNPVKNKIDELFDYTVIMAPIPKRVASSVVNSAKSGIINIFAGIPATVNAEIELDSYIEKQLYFVGTSGSTLEDMETVLRKVEAGLLDTNISVGAICGLKGAIEGIRAVENQKITGKIIVYPACEELDLIELENLKKNMPEIFNSLNDGLWNKAAEDNLLTAKGT